MREIGIFTLPVALICGVIAQIDREKSKSTGFRGAMWFAAMGTATITRRFQIGAWKDAAPSVVRSAATRMKAGGYGGIVNLSSVSGCRAGIGRTAGGTWKAVIAHLARQIALELGRGEITANAIAPETAITRVTAADYTGVDKARFPNWNAGLTIVEFRCSAR